MPNLDDSDYLKRLEEALARLPGSSQPQPDVCSQCGGTLTILYEMHCSGNQDGQRRTWWIAWSSCPACQLFFTLICPPRSPDKHGWQLDPEPPDWVRDPDWFSRLKQEIDVGTTRPQIQPVSAHAWLAELEFSERVTVCLEGHNIATVADLCARSAADLLKIRNFGAAALQEVRNRLAKSGLKLKDD